MKQILAVSTAVAIAASSTAAFAAPRLQPGSHPAPAAVSSLQSEAGFGSRLTHPALGKRSPERLAIIPPIESGDGHQWGAPVGGVSSVPSYLLRGDGALINGLLPISPDAQG